MDDGAGAEGVCERCRGIDVRSEAILRAAETISRQYARASMGPLRATGYGLRALLPRPSAIPAGTNSRHPLQPIPP